MSQYLILHEIGDRLLELLHLLRQSELPVHVPPAGAQDFLREFAAFLQGADEHADLSLAVRRKLDAAVLNLVDRGLDGLDEDDESVGDAFVFPCFGGYEDELFEKLGGYFAGEEIGDCHLFKWK